jgi:hypothetical protein
MAQHANVTTVKEEKARTTNQPKIGSMYMFSYNPKWKKKLPYYDRFPLIFPIDKAPGGFYGINFHYLPHRLRARLMDALYKVASDRRYDEHTKLKINYRLLKSLTRVPYYKPTVKHYLNKHVKSNFIQVFPAEWDIALFLDTQKFEKASAQKVWEDSANMIQGIKPAVTKPSKIKASITL